MGDLRHADETRTHDHEKRQFAELVVIEVRRNTFCTKSSGDQEPVRRRVNLRSDKVEIEPECFSKQRADVFPIEYQREKMSQGRMGKTDVNPTQKQPRKTGKQVRNILRPKRKTFAS